MLTLSFEDEWSEETFPQMDVTFPQDLVGTSSGCVDLEVPSFGPNTYEVRLDTSGTIGGEDVSESFVLSIAQGGRRTFVQTDKYLYKPGQTVNIRILTIEGPNLEVSTENYAKIYLRNPSGTRIAQWLDVDNSGGLVHLSFQLYDESEEGVYRIILENNEEDFQNIFFSSGASFKVEDYVLPRYEITVTPPDYILGSDSSVTIEVCAEYTYGEPVTGEATVVVIAGFYEDSPRISQTKQINGCENFVFSREDLRYDEANCFTNINSLRVSASAIEEGTGVELKSNLDYFEIHRRVVNFVDDVYEVIEKPYVPVFYQVRATYPDGTPAANEPMLVCIGGRSEGCNEYTSDEEGYVKFYVGLNYRDTVTITAVNYPRERVNRNDVMRESISSFFKYFVDYLQPSSYSLTLLLEKELECVTGEDPTYEITVLYIAENDTSADVNLQISARGQIILSDIKNVQFTDTALPLNEEEELTPLEELPEGLSRGVFTFTVTLDEIVSPEISVLVWYVSGSNTIIAESKKVKVSGCLSHNVDFTWSDDIVEPGDSATLTITGENNALCSIDVVDKSVKLLPQQYNALTVGRILSLAYNSLPDYYPNQLNIEYCISKHGEVKNKETPPPPPNDDCNIQERSIIGPSLYIDPYSAYEALHMFNKRGYYVLTNLVVEQSFCDRILSSEKFEYPVYPGGELGGSFAGGVSLGSQGSPDGLGDGSSQQGFGGPSPGGQESLGSPPDRDFFPESWLFILETLSNTGEYSVAKTLPDTITEWVGRAVCVHLTEGVGISAEASIITFKDFFIDLTLPASAQRGESLPIIISVFNYLDVDLPVLVTVEENGFNFADGETGTFKICVPSKKKVVRTVNVILTEIGDIDIIVDAVTEERTCSLMELSILALTGESLDPPCDCGPEILPEAQDRIVRSFPVEPEGYVRERTFNEYVCSEDVSDPSEPFATFVIEAPADIVEDSERAWLTASGDLLGPAVENLENLIRLPSGCGEQNMVRFAPNVYIRKYLKATGQLNDELESKTDRFMSRGYQNQLRYERSDGSYSAFGTRDEEGSTWLTAFVLKVYAEASEFTVIDPDAISRTSSWLLGLQDSQSGCFMSNGRVINKMLQGSINSSSNSDSAILLTSFVMISIIKAEVDFDDTTALGCISSPTSDNPYSLALKGYALALSENDNGAASPIIQQLLNVAVVEEGTMRWNLPNRQGTSTSLHIETAAYALLALLELDATLYTEESRQIVRWLTNQRNGQGGFVSTQDTVVALEALAAFETINTQQTLNLEIQVSSDNLNRVFTITEDNKFLEQREDVPSLPSTVDLSLSGQGCAVVQAVLRYNVLAESTSDAFTLSVESTQTPDCEVKQFKACTTYTLSDEASLMAIMEVKLVSGYIPFDDDLRDIVNGGNGPFKRYEIDRSKVILYIEEVTENEICASFRVRQQIAFDVTKPGSVMIYDYYQPEFLTTKSFSFGSGC